MHPEISVTVYSTTNCVNTFISYLQLIHHSLCLQCFDTVGWASGRASGL